MTTTVPRDRNNVRLSQSAAPQENQPYRQEFIGGIKKRHLVCKIYNVDKGGRGTQLLQSMFVKTVTLDAIKLKKRNGVFHLL